MYLYNLKLKIAKIIRLLDIGTVFSSSWDFSLGKHTNHSTYILIMYKINYITLNIQIRI